MTSEKEESTKTEEPVTDEDIKKILEARRRAIEEMASKPHLFLDDGQGVCRWCGFAKDDTSKHHT